MGGLGRERGVQAAGGAATAAFSDEVCVLLLEGCLLRRVTDGVPA
jgi:hypothetical protein